MNARQSQSSKIKELGNALLAAGFFSLDRQAKALGLPRSTTWNILKGNHKGPGLSAAVINRMLRAPQLPPLVRAIILTYVDDKIAGLYGHNKLQLRRFTASLSYQRSHLRTELVTRQPATSARFDRGPRTLVALAADGGTQ